MTNIKYLIGLVFIVLIGFGFWMSRIYFVSKKGETSIEVLKTEPNSNDCKSCHAKILSATNLHYRNIGGDCLTCHEQINAEHPSSDVAGDFSFNSDSINGLCKKCHNEIFEKVDENIYIHSAITEYGCTGCHNPHGSDNVNLLTKSIETICLNCHEYVNTDESLVHAPVKNRNCTGCHYSHGSNYPLNLANEAKILCANCHSKNHNDYGSGCTKCHSGHGSDRPFFIKSPYSHYVDVIAEIEKRENSESVNNIISDIKSGDYGQSYYRYAQVASDIDTDFGLVDLVMLSSTSETGDPYVVGCELSYKDICNATIFGESKIYYNNTALENFKKFNIFTNENITLAYDASTFVEPSKGIVVTNKAVYWKNFLRDPVRVDVDKLNSLTLGFNGFVSEITWTLIVNNDDNLVIGLYGIDDHAILPFVYALAASINFNKNNSDDVVLSVNEKASAALSQGIIERYGEEIELATYLAMDVAAHSMLNDNDPSNDNLAQGLDVAATAGLLRLRNFVRATAKSTPKATVGKTWIKVRAETINKIASQANFRGAIYKIAQAEKKFVKGVKPEVVAGRLAYKRDIFKVNRRNCGLMRKGRAPLGENFESIQIHHASQEDSGELIEMTRAEHLAKDSGLHPKRSDSEINRKQFDKIRSDHWKARATELCQ